MPQVTYTVTATGRDATRTDVQARDHAFAIDEPTKLGGSDAGPNPLEYLLGALAGCLNVTGWKVAQEMGIELRGLSFELSGTLDPRRFMGKESDERAGFREIRVNAKADTDATQEQLDAWAEAVEARCPVSDNIHGETAISVSAGGTE